MPEAVAGDSKLLFTSTATFDILSSCLRALLWRLVSLDSGADDWLVRCGEQSIMLFDGVGLYVYNDQPSRFPSPGDTAEVLSMSG